MERTRTSQVAGRIGQLVQIAGWLRVMRNLGGVTFAIVEDGWGELQAVWETAAVEPLAGVGLESVVRLEGVIVRSPQAPGGIELREPSVEVVSLVNEELPLPMQRRALAAGLPTLLDEAVLGNRHPSRRAVIRLGAAAMAGFRAELDEQDFTEIQTPKIVASATEGGANVFGVDYFGRPAYLAQSPQFYKQVMVGAFERVYEVGPVFRAEPHDTARHLNEYVSLDAEFGFIESHHTVMALLRDVMAAIFERIAAACPAELAGLRVTMPSVPAVIPEVHFIEAKRRAAESLGPHVIAEPDLAPDEERVLGTWARQAFDSDFLFVTGYPLAKRPFYTHPDPERPGSSRGFDLLFRGMELVTGGQRLHRHEEYLGALADRGIDPAPFAWYLDAFRYGMPPHGGFAIGLERLLMQLAGLSNVRLAATFPRDLRRLVP